MKIFKKLVAFILLSCFFSTAYTQVSDVDLYTGTNYVSIPIWTCTTKGFSLPITLNYNASGIKVDQMASWVGLGWELNAGGMISREVKGFPDDIERTDIPQKGWLFTAIDPSTSPSQNKMIGKIMQDFDETVSSLQEEFWQSEYLEVFMGADGYYSGYLKYDMEPDIFHFNCGGFSGSFLFDGAGEIRLLTASNIIIKVTDWDANDQIIEFTITDEDGNKYIFKDNHRGTICETQYDNPDSNEPPLLKPPAQPSNVGYKYLFPNTHTYYPSEYQSYTSEWFLSEIITYYNDKIEFTYMDEEYHLDESELKIYNDFISSQSNNLWKELVINSFQTGAPNYPIHKTKRLAEIESDYFKISFIAANEARLDICDEDTDPTKPCKYLESIEVYSKIYPFSTPTIPIYTGIRKFLFHYDYFQAYTNGSMYYNLPDYSFYKRLKLLSVQESDFNELFPQPPFQFQYNSTQLPPRLSYDKDFWGYFLGTVNNTTLVPSLYVYPDLDLDGSYRFRLFPIEINPNWIDIREYVLPGADRTSDEGYMKAGILEKVVFPTGGYEEFEYEIHEFEDVTQFSNSQYNSNEITTTSEGGGLRLKQRILSDGNDHSKDVITTYSYFEGKAVSLPVFGYFDPNAWENFNGDPFCNITYPNLTDYFNSNYFRTTSNLADQSDGNIGYNRVIATREGAQTSSTLGWTEYTFNNEGCYGELISTDGIFDRSEVNWCRYPGEQGNCSTNTPSSYPIVETPYMHFEYDAYPFAPNINYYWARGNPSSITIYDAQGKKQEKRDFTYNSYPAIPTSVYGIKLGFLSNNINCTCQSSNYTDCCSSYCTHLVSPLKVFSKYEILTGVSKLPSSILITRYDENENPTLTKTNTLSYNDFAQLSKASTIESNGTEKAIVQIYPMDFWDLKDPVNILTQSEIDLLESKSKALYYLSDKNRINDPVEKIHLEKGAGQTYSEVIGANINSWQTYEFTDNGVTYPLPLPQSNYNIEIVSPINYDDPSIPSNQTFLQAALNSVSKDLEFDNRYTPNAFIDEYDGNKNIIEFHNYQDIPQSKIWGYDDNQLVADVQNAHQEEIAYTGFENDEYLKWSTVGNIIPSASSYSGENVLELNQMYGPSFLAPVVYEKPISGYKASVWVKGPETAYLHIEINGDWSSHDRAYNPAGSSEWHLLEVELSRDQIEAIWGQTGKEVLIYIGNTSSVNAHFDELRFHPSDAIMTSYAYDPMVGITSISSTNQKTQWREYDALGRQTYVRDQDKNIIQANTYHYGNVAEYTWDPTDVTINTQITFTPLCEEGTNYSISFNDGSTDPPSLSSHGSFQHVFTQTGTFSVELQVTKNGIVYSKTHVIVVQ
jgi:hypothetical protein